jgi:hypothetical protein
MNRRDKIRLEQLDALDVEFRDLLVSCLEQCARGRRGLFGQNAHIPEAAWFLAWPEADRMRKLAISIQATLARSGEQNALCREFLDMCNNHTQNDPGEPKLARAFLDRMERGT